MKGSDPVTLAAMVLFFMKALPMTMPLTRRTFFATSAAATAATAATALSPQTIQAAPDPRAPFRFCLNTSTVRECQYQGKKIDIVGEIEVAAKAGYTGIEPWIGEIDDYVKRGGTLPDLKKRIADAGLIVESAIGFAAFLAEDDSERQQGLVEAKRCMGLVREIGGTRLAAPPVGVTEK